MKIPRPRNGLRDAKKTLIYTNDIHNSSAKLSFCLFAGDTNLLYDDTNLKSL